MPGCCAFGCTNRNDKGFKMYRFPSDPNRRELWENKVNRVGWKSTSSSRLCEAHFDNHQFENGRIDQKKKLKGSAVPTIFCHQRTPKARKSIKKCGPSTSGTSPSKKCVISHRDDHNYAADLQIQRCSSSYHPMKAQLNHGMVSPQLKWSTKLSTEVPIEEEEASKQVEMTTKKKIADFEGSVYTHMLPFKCSPHPREQAIQDLEESSCSSFSKGCSNMGQKSKSKQMGAQRISKTRGRITRGTSNGGGSDCSDEDTVVDFPFIHVDMEHFAKEELNGNDLVIKEHSVGKDFLTKEIDGIDEIVVKEEKDVDESMMNEDEFRVKVEDSLDCVVKEEVEIDERLKEEPGGIQADCNGKETKEWYVEGCTIKQEVEEGLNE
ncbi:uncharacterized protein LOC143034472 isoform X2 [Oratosquilla oratoria]|uniref:uncharacterized protein LOC143034472 isoform X2 n=1 Tax=Oratosquilla oratoria TaxID=337810 RepID=UPI003F75A07B